MKSLKLVFGFLTGIRTLAINPTNLSKILFLGKGDLPQQSSNSCVPDKTRKKINVLTKYIIVVVFHNMIYLFVNSLLKASKFIRKILPDIFSRVSKFWLSVVWDIDGVNNYFFHPDFLNMEDNFSDARTASLDNR